MMRGVCDQTINPFVKPFSRLPLNQVYVKIIYISSYNHPLHDGSDIVRHSL